MSADDLWDEGYRSRDEEIEALKKKVMALEQQLDAYYGLLSARKRVEGPSLEREIDEFYKKREETSQPL